ncbi:MAG: hypothetical protein A3F11_01495 [Gammaproteobacteria bacterium RIFCSPHIGHO2_12_FULL_37_14]|nr:MAG: hypothetical protein A3F11_01495 [Gammaproteobacteria bacterium RIFCSPHIGHO2_12_FULL_37_14]
MNIVYLNGDFLEMDQAKVSVMDRGFLFGDGVYEVIPSYKQKLIGLDYHLERLAICLNMIKIDFQFKKDDFIPIYKKLLKQNQLDDCLFYLQITRGSGDKRSYLFPKNIKPTVFICCIPFSWPTIASLEKGYAAYTTEDIRWAYASIKSLNLLPSVLLSQEALEKNAVEAILIRNQQVIEGSVSNIFLVKDKRIITPNEQACMLSGITRMLIIQLANTLSYPLDERTVRVEELYHADEIWLTGSSKTILPIIELDGKRIGKGKAGPVWKQFVKHFFDDMEMLSHNL